MTIKHTQFLILGLVIFANTHAGDWTFYNCASQNPPGTNNSPANITVTWDPVLAGQYQQTYSIGYGQSYTESTKAAYTSLVSTANNAVTFNNTQGSGSQAVTLNNAQAPHGGGSFIIVPDSNGEYTFETGTGCPNASIAKKEYATKEKEFRK